ncbi:MAG: hypothetical protein K8R11_10385 [Methanococcoides sp.]|nr:hypothetical protein [Methanococcoides sp.]
MMGKKWLIIAGEEAEPKSNKMGGIWDVIDAEATTLASLVNSGDTDEDKFSSSRIVLSLFCSFTSSTIR